MIIYVGLYHHRHGVSVYPLAKDSEDELIAAIEAEGEELELDREDEWLEIVGSFDLSKMKNGKQS